MNMASSKNPPAHKTFTTISFVVGILFLLGIPFFLYTNSSPSCEQLSAINFFLALGTASFVVGLPGTLKVNLHPAITGTGAVAALLLILWFKPMGNIDCYGQLNKIWGQLFIDETPVEGYTIELNNVQGVTAQETDSKGQFEFQNLSILVLPEFLELYIKEPSTDVPYFHEIGKSQYSKQELIKIYLNTENNTNVVQYNQEKKKLEEVRVPSVSRNESNEIKGSTLSHFNINGRIWRTSNENTKTDSGSWCLDNIISNCEKYGRLYKWDVAKTVCPDGWRLPTRDEWVCLIHSIADEDDIHNETYFSKKIYDKMINSEEFPFNAQLSGVKWGEDLPLEFYMNGFRGYYWSSTEIDDDKVYALEVNGEQRRVAIRPFKKEFSMSCRCIKVEG